MSEKEVIGKSNEPKTIKTLTADLKNIGIKEGMVLLVHSSLSSIGWVVSGAMTVSLLLKFSQKDLVDFAVNWMERNRK